MYATRRIPLEHSFCMFLFSNSAPLGSTCRECLGFLVLRALLVSTRGERCALLNWMQSRAEPAFLVQRQLLAPWLRQ